MGAHLLGGKQKKVKRGGLRRVGEIVVREGDLGGKET